SSDVCCVHTRAVFLLIDIRHATSANDRLRYHWVTDQGYHPIIIATKLDKIKRSQIQKHLKMLREGLELVPGTKIIPFSSVTKQGREEIWELIETEYLEPKAENQDQARRARWKADDHTGRWESGCCSAFLPRRPSS